MTWTPERIITLRKLWTIGESASAIAANLGGVSKNAVIGKARRFNLPAHPKTTRQRARAPALPRSPAPLRPRTPAPALPRSRAPVIPEMAPPPDRHPTTRDISPNQCCWPEGDPKKNDFFYCGRPPIPGKPYCPHHYARAYKKQSNTPN